MSDGGTATTLRTQVVWWFSLVVFGRLYTVLQCDVAGRLLGFDALCWTWINDIALYLWVELILYGPLMWLALHLVNTDVFRDLPADPGAQKQHRRLAFIGSAAAAIFIYGVGVHVADTIEVFSRERQGIAEGPVYDLVYFLDEGVSHYIQFVSLFFVIGWWVIHDRAGRVAHPKIALFFGVAHGVERALGTIEGEKWFLGPALIAWMSGAAWLRWRRVGSGAADEFFFRYAVAFSAVMPLCLGAYFLRFGEFAAPSGFDDGDYVQLVAGVIALIAVSTATAIATDRWLRAHRHF